MRRIVPAVLVLLASSTALTAQSPSPAKFEVASIKPAEKQLRGGSRPMSEITLSVVRVLPGGRVESYGHMLRNLIAWAYDVDTLHRKIEGGKQEILETEFVITATTPDPSATSAEVKLMFRTLLEERFQLRWRLQPREIDGYLLMPAREDGHPGAALRPFTEDCAARADSRAIPFDSPEYEQKARCGWSGINSRQRAIGLSMSVLAERLTIYMAAPVSDRTGWPGLFTFDVFADTSSLPYMARMRSAGFGAPVQTDAPQLLDVFRSELGLKLVTHRVSIDDFIIERIEPLIEN